MIKLLQSKHSDLVSLGRRFHVQRLEVFGSAARGDDFDPARSDVEFLVEFAPDSPISPLDARFGLQEEFAATLGHQVELMSPSAVCNPYVKASIDRSREVVYGA